MELLEFCKALGHGVCDFLLTEPIYYFTGVFILMFVGFLVRKIVD